jgi:DNA-binding CsgD family transcriptional regulator
MGSGMHEDATSQTAATGLVISARMETRLRVRDLLEGEGFRVQAVGGLDAIDEASIAAAEILVIELGPLDGVPAELIATHACVLLGDWPEAPPTGDAPAAYLYADATADELLAAIAAVRAGLAVFDPSLAGRNLPAVAAETGAAPGEQLTPRELEVLRLMAEGLPNKGIGRALGISDHTAKFHVGAILGKLDAQSRAEAVMLAARRGLLPL